MCAEKFNLFGNKTSTVFLIQPIAETTDHRYPGIFIGPNDDLLQSELQQNKKNVKKKARTLPLTSRSIFSSKSREFCTIPLLIGTEKIQTFVTKPLGVQQAEFIHKKQTIQSKVPISSSSLKKNKPLQISATATVPSHIVTNKKTSKILFSKPRQYSKSKSKGTVGKITGRYGFKKSKSNCSIHSVETNGGQVTTYEQFNNYSSNNNYNPCRAAFNKSLLKNETGPPGDGGIGLHLSDSTLDILRQNSKHNPDCPGCLNYQQLLIQATEIISARDSCLKSQKKELDFFVSFNTELKNLAQQSYEESGQANFKNETNLCSCCGVPIQNISTSASKSPSLSSYQYSSLGNSPRVPGGSRIPVKKSNTSKKISQKESVDSMIDYLQERRVRKSGMIRNKSPTPKRIAFEDSSDDNQNTSINRTQVLQVPQKNIRPNLELQDEIASLRIAVAARQSLLNELQSRIKKANRILNHRFSTLTAVPDQAISHEQFHEILESHRKFVRWLNKYTVRGIEDISKFEQLNIGVRSENCQINYYIETIVKIDGVDTDGVFIPIPTDTGCKLVQETIPVSFPSRHAVNENINIDNAIEKEDNILTRSPSDLCITNEIEETLDDSDTVWKTTPKKSGISTNVNKTTELRIRASYNADGKANSSHLATINEISSDINMDGKILRQQDKILTVDTNEKFQLDKFSNSTDFNNNHSTNQILQTKESNVPDNFNLTIQTSINSPDKTEFYVNDVNCNFPVADLEYPKKGSSNLDRNSDIVSAIMKKSNIEPIYCAKETCGANFAAFTKSYEDFDNSPIEEIFRRKIDPDKCQSTIVIDSSAVGKKTDNKHLSDLSILPLSQNEGELKYNRSRNTISEENIRKQMCDFKNMLKNYRLETSEIKNLEHTNSNYSNDGECENQYLLQSSPIVQSSSVESLLESQIQKYSDMKAQDEEIHKNFRNSQSSRQFNESIHGLDHIPCSTSKKIYSGTTTEQSKNDSPVIECNVNPILMNCVQNNWKQHDKSSHIFESTSNNTSSLDTSQKPQLETPINKIKTPSIPKLDNKASIHSKINKACELNEIIASFHDMLSPLMDSVQTETFDTKENLLKTEVEALRKQLSKTNLIQQFKSFENSPDKYIFPESPTPTTPIQKENSGYQIQTKIPAPKYKLASPRGKTVQDINLQETIVSPRKIMISKVLKCPVPIQSSAYSTKKSHIIPPTATQHCKQQIEELEEKQKYSTLSKPTSTRCKAAFDITNTPQCRPRSISISPPINPNPLNPTRNPKSSYTTEYEAAFNRFGWKQVKGKE